MFAELLAKTCFSFLEGGSQPREVIQRAAELGLSAIGVADREGLYGIARAHEAALKLAKAGLPSPKLIVGAELTLLDESSRISLLVEDVRGYQNLCQLITAAHLDLPKGESALPFSALEGRTSGLWAMMASPYDEALAAKMKALFGDHVRLVVHRHLVGDDRARDHEARRIAQLCDIGIVASARPLYHDASRRPLCDVLACIRMGVTIDEAGARIAPNAEAFLRAEADIRRLYRDHPDWLDGTGEIANACTFSMSELRALYQFPCEVHLAGETPNEAIKRLVREHAPRRFPNGVPDSVSTQLGKELDLICARDIAPHFLSVYEIVELARERGILCQGRGSAANSAVCFVLGITSVDPLRSNLLFERFLSVNRHEPPDIDVDFEHERREEVIQEIYRRYGRKRAAMVSEVISYRGKSALREVGKVFGLSEDQTNQMSSLLLHHEHAISEERIREAGLDPRNARLRHVLSISSQIQGFPRHMSVHSGGFVLCANALTDVAPVEPARMEGRTVVQWDKDDIDTLGFFKVDVLALGMLTAIRKAMEMIEVHGEGPREDKLFDAVNALATIPDDDPAVYEAFSRADTIGVFQIESRAQQAMLPNLKPRTFYDLVIEVAIVRPGPIQGGMVHPYLKRRAGTEKAEPPHPSLEPILARTLGIPLFQEQVMQIAIVGAGYTGGQADQLRRDMASWRKNGQLEQHRPKLIEGFAKKGISEKFSEALYKQIQGFGDYGFPESHAASFALLVYASGWLKVHHPAAFVCALLNSQPMGFYSSSSLVQDAQRHGVEAREIDIRRSGWDCALEWDDSKSKPAGDIAQPALRLGMRQLRGFSEKRANAIVWARSTEPFRDVDDLVRRARLNKRETEILAEAGALEGLVRGRREALWRARAPRVEGLFEHIPLAEKPPALPPLEAAQQLKLDYEHTGLSITDHPMRHVRPRLARDVLTIASLLQTKHKSKVTIAGMVQSRQRPETASGVVFMTLEDESGTANIVLWATLFEANRFVAVNSKMLLVRGTLERVGTVVHVLAKELVRLDSGADMVRTSSRDFH